MFQKILVAIDGSPASEKALAAAVDLAAQFKADLTALGVVVLPEVVGMVDEVDEMRQRTEGHWPCARSWCAATPRTPLSVTPKARG
jgi:nucleotide-binding universal stress UspA family protein